MSNCQIAYLITDISLLPGGRNNITNRYENRIYCQSDQHFFPNLFLSRGQNFDRIQYIFTRNLERMCFYVGFERFQTKCQCVKCKLFMRNTRENEQKLRWETEIQNSTCMKKAMRNFEIVKCLRTFENIESQCFRIRKKISDD